MYLIRQCGCQREARSGMVGLGVVRQGAMGRGKGSQAIRRRHEERQDLQPETGRAGSGETRQDASSMRCPGAWLARKSRAPPLAGS